MNNSINSEFKDQYLLDDNKLKPCDIILTTTTQKVSKLIRIATGGEYSHAILYVGGHSCIDSTTNGVQAHNIQRMLFDSPEFCKVLRYKDSIEPKSIESIIDFARAKVGTAYSVPEAIQAGIKIKDDIKERNRQFCSRLVAQAYHNNGFDIVKNPNYSTPEEINKSDKLIEIENALRIAHPEEVKLALETNTILEKQENSQNFILESTRKLLGVDIQTFEQVGGIVLMFSAFDDEICRIFKESGFLDLWKHDLEVNPWFYDYDKFLEHFKNSSQRKDIGQKQSVSELETKRRFETTLKTLKNGDSKMPLKTFKIQIELYEKLIELSNIRANVWEQAKK